MKRILLCVTVLIGLGATVAIVAVPWIGSAIAQTPMPAISPAPRMPSGADVTAVVNVCFNYSTQTFQYCSQPSAPTYSSDGGANTHVTNFPATQPVSGTVADSNSAPYGGSVTLTSGTADSAYRRSIGFTCTGSGSLILATPDGNSSTIDIIGSIAMQYAPWAVNMITIGTATGCSRLLNIK